MQVEAEVRSVSEAFYAALNRMGNGDASAIVESWSHSATVTAMHPIGGRHLGWDAVWTSFARFSELASEGTIELTDQLIHVADGMACEVGVERGRMKLAGQPVTIDVRVTNVYRHEDGAWKMIHHHTDVAPEVLAVLAQLQADKAEGPELAGGEA